ncbi:MAG: DUF2793 domain-containing protein [Parasphingopyxis sp.]
MPAERPAPATCWCSRRGRGSQAQKELYHNEALAILDGALHPAAESRGDDVPPASPEIGECWIVGGAPSGDWTGRADTLAIWTAGGWRFVAPVAGMTVWLKDSELFARWTGTGWIDGEIVGSVLRLGDNQVVGERQPAISDASGGTIVDIEARDAISLILDALRAHGLVAE